MVKENLLAFIASSGSLINAFAPLPQATVRELGLMDDAWEAQPSRDTVSTFLEREYQQITSTPESSFGRVLLLSVGVLTTAVAGALYWSGKLKSSTYAEIPTSSESAGVRMAMLSVEGESEEGEAKTPGEVDAKVISDKQKKKNMIMGALGLGAAALFAAGGAAWAAEEAAGGEGGPEGIDLNNPPMDFGLSRDFYTDATKVTQHMRFAVQMPKAYPRLVEIAQMTKEEMLDFVSYYRRFPGINGKQSFSLLYTSINVLSGHYTSYGTKFPLPEKRRKRLLQEFKDIEKNIRKKR